MEKGRDDSGPHRPAASHKMDRNPSPPSSDDEGPSGDSIGNTVYSKRWFFSILTRLIQLVTRKEGPGAKSLELEEDMENDICKIWDMSMNEEVAIFLKEFEAPEIFLGIIKKTKCNRLTEICVGILGNMACFPETCKAISKNKELGEVLLLLMCDPDPPTLLEATRLLLTCVSQVDVMSTWLERIRKRPTVRDNLCFIMSSSTNVDLLVKVGELVDKMFDMDEDLMIHWIKARCQQPETATTDGEEEKSVVPGLVPALLEAAKQLRHDSPEGLDVYMHVLQLVTTVDEGVQAIVLYPEDAKQTWDFLCDLMYRDLCQPDDPPLAVQEQKTVLSSVVSVMSVIFSSQTEAQYSEIGKNLYLVGCLFRILEKLEIIRKKSEYLQLRDLLSQDFHLKILKSVCSEFFSNILCQLSKDDIEEVLKEGYITGEKCVCVLRSLLPLHAASVNRFMMVLGETDQTLSETLKEGLGDFSKKS